MSSPPDHDTRSDVLVRNIERRRAALGLSAQEVAKRAGLAEHYLRDLESRGAGRTGPGVFQLQSIAAVLGCTIDQLLGGPAPSLDGLAVVDQDRLDVLEKARSVADLEPIRRKTRYYVGMFLSEACRIVPATELEEIERRHAARVEELHAAEEDEDARRRKRRDR